MFSPLFGYLESQPASANTMEAGDFDNTPAPSTRPSLAILRDQTDGEASRPDNASLGRAASYKHHLLKTSASGPLLVDTDISAPPVLSRYSPPSPVRYDSSAPQRQPENKPTNAKHGITPPQTTSPVVLPENRGVSPDIPASERVCLDPTLHVRDTHAHAHHPGLLKGADFCDTGAPTREIGPVLSSSGSTSSEPEDTRGYEGHSRIVKVRPAFNYHPMQDVANHSTANYPHYGHSVNKVQPFSSVSQSVRTAAPDSTTSGSEDRESIRSQATGSGVMLSLSVPTTKVRPFNSDDTSRHVTHEFDLHESKVKPFVEIESIREVVKEDRPEEQVPPQVQTDQDLTKQHTLSVDTKFPLDVAPDEHVIDSCAEHTTEINSEGHKASQCLEYPV